jgi:hypothetical protein
MGLSSNSSSTVVKPLLLDNYFPFDPYMLPRTKHWVEPHYRPHEVCPSLLISSISVAST